MNQRSGTTSFDGFNGIVAWSKRLILSVCFLVAINTSTWGQTYTTITQNGLSANRVNMVFAGDGYTTDEIETTYVQHINNMLTGYFDPNENLGIARYEKFFNVYRVNVISNESGVDLKYDDSSQNVYHDTALNGSNDGRISKFSTSMGNLALSNAFFGTDIDVDMKVGVLNTTRYGGLAPGDWGMFSGGAAHAMDLARHELGHSFADLADEYFYEGDVYRDSESEPREVNATKSSTGDKWSHWLGYDDPDTNIGPVGAFEGSKYHEFGLYRPTNKSTMKWITDPFNAVSREQIILEIYKHVDPLDQWQSNAVPIQNDLDSVAEVWVDVIDTDVIKMQWFLDGQLVDGATETSLDLDRLGLTEDGNYELVARAYDEVLDFAFTGLSLDWVRRDQEMLEQFMVWTIDFTAPLLGDINMDGVVNGFDVDPFVALVLGGGDYNSAADINADGFVNGFDVDPFVALILGNDNGNSPPASNIPDPATISLLSLGGLICLKRKK